MSLLASVGAVLLAVAGCAEPGSSGATASESGGPDPTAPRTGEPHTGRDGPSDVAPAVEPEDRPGEARIQEGEPLPEDRVDGRALPENHPRKVNLASSGTVLAIVATESGCGRAAAELVEETARHVIVELSETQPESPGEVMCTMDIRHPTVRVALAEPLGQRDVVLRRT